MSDKQTVLVTGASSGIGLQLARLAAKDGHSLLITAREEAKLQYVASQLADHFKVQVDFRAIDLAERGAVKKIIEWVGDRPVDILINNAGFGDFGEFALADTKRIIDMMHVNMTVVTELMHWALPGMVKRHRGTVMNLASMAAFMSGPLMATYHATKAYVLSLSEAVDQELVGTGVHVMAVCPGPTATGFEQAAHIEESAFFRGPGVMSAEAVANAAWAGLEKHSRLVIPGWRNTVSVWLIRLAPRRLITSLVHHAQKRVP